MIIVLVTWINKWKPVQQRLGLGTSMVQTEKPTSPIIQQIITCFTLLIFFLQSVSLFFLHIYLNFSFKHFAKFISIVCNTHPSHHPPFPCCPSLTALMDAGGRRAPVVEANLCSQSSVHLSSITLHLRRLQDTLLPASEGLTYVVLLFWLQLEDVSVY